MRLPEICISRPVLATVISLLLVLLGAVSYQRLTIREYPRIEEPVITVETRYPGASSEIIESQVTEPLEELLSGVEDLDVMTSVSRAEASQITLRFRASRDPDAAAADVRDRVGRTRDLLPDEIDEPIIAKVEADAEPIMFLTLASSSHSALVVSDVADRQVKDRLQNLPGVSAVRVYGERRYAMRIWLDPARLAAYELTTQDVESAVRSQNVEIPAGRIESRDREFTVLAETDLQSRSSFERIVIREVNGYPVRLRDVATVDISFRDDRVGFRVDRQSAMGIGVIKQSTANPLEVSKAVTAAVPSIMASLPPGMNLAIVYDTSVFIDESIAAVFRAIAESVGLVMLVIFIFLRSVRATVIPLVTIPVSLIASFTLMWILGFSVNTLTLLAMVLAVGLVVDDAIVVLENISRHVEAGMRPIAAAIKGSREIAFAVVAMTATLAAVYAPVAFQTGRTGRLFIEFALTLAGAVLVSGLVALTLSPMMSSRLLRHQARHGAFYNVIERVIIGLTNGYRRALGAALRLRVIVALVVLVIAGVGYGLFAGLRSELSPSEDRGAVIGIAIASEGSTVEYMMRQVQRLETVFAGVPDLDRIIVIQGFPTVNQIIAPLVLKDWGDRSSRQQDIAAALGPRMFGVPGVLAFPLNPPSLGQSFFGSPVEVIVQTTDSYPALADMVAKVMVEARKYPGFASLDADIRLNKPELKIDVNRDKLADLGIEVATLGRTLETMLGGREVTRFKYEGQQYDVVIQVLGRDRRSPADLSAIHVRNSAGVMVPLSNVVTVKESVAPRELSHFNKLRSAKITATPAPGYTLGDGIQYLEDAAKRVLPQPARTDLGGQSREFREATAGLYVTFGLALAFIYLVLAAQFESFVDPLVIMFTVPLATTGALAALWLTGGTINVYSQIGLVTLIGLITKHGILIVEFANQLRDAGRPLGEAIVEAAVLRLRPILMTTGAMILGAVPLAAAAGAGAESRSQIGWVIIGGMAFGTLFTLFVVPAAYSLLAARRRNPMLVEAEAASVQPQQP